MPPTVRGPSLLWSALTGIGGVLGNLGGGLAAEFGGWRTLFWSGVPLALGAAVLIASRVPDQTPHRDPVDGGGGLLLTAGSVALLYGIIDGPELGWGSWQVLGSLILAIVLLGAFALYERRIERPIAARIGARATIVLGLLTLTARAARARGRRARRDRRGVARRRGRRRSRLRRSRRGLLALAGRPGSVERPRRVGRLHRPAAAAFPRRGVTRVVGISALGRGTPGCRSGRPGHGLAADG
jgi:hypothetical protein